MVSKTAMLEQYTGVMDPTAPTGQPAMAPLAGQPLPQNGASLAAGGDNMNAVITDQAGNPQGPAKIKAGEIVFSVDSIIGAGNGDYDKGAQLILGLHDKLQSHGEALVQKQSLAGAPPTGLQPQAAPQGLATPQPAPAPSNGLAGAPVEAPIG